ncbi:MAG: 4-hydroxybutyrate dehydrogenase [Lachnospiraceae bacterium]|nr:4-hydroxybutyrate dehydrogenase [Lachnospiraceae bacterium]
MIELMLKPCICSFSSVEEFTAQFQPGRGDIIITNEFLYTRYFQGLDPDCDVIFQEKYGSGEPTDEMVEAMYADIMGQHSRIIAAGGGTVLDIAKLFALKEISPVIDLYDGKIAPVKNKELILIPTTCGTGSEVTNISILALTAKGTKKGLASDALYADYAVLIPELLENLPFSVFAASSIDALVHAVEASLSPKGNDTIRIFGYKAIEMILSGYKTIEKYGPQARIPLMNDFLKASNYAGIAFSNAGCAAVHAMAYPLGATYHVPHGESNYALFTGVMKNYMEIRSDGEIAALNQFMAGILGCDVSKVYEELEGLLSHLLPKKPLRAYGMKEEEIDTFTDSVIANQQRLLANNFVFLDRNRIYKIYRELY